MNRSQMAAALGIQPGTLDQWTRDGCPVEDRPGQGRPATFCAPDVIRWARDRDLDRALGKASKGATSEELGALKARRLELDNERREIDLARLRGELARVEDIAHAFGRMILGAKSALLGNVPRRVAQEVSLAPGGSVAAITAREMRAALADLSARGIIDLFREAGLRVGVEEIGGCDRCQRVAELIEAARNLDEGAAT